MGGGCHFDPLWYYPSGGVGSAGFEPAVFAV